MDSIRTARANGGSAVSISRRFSIHRMTVWTYTKDLLLRVDHAFIVAGGEITNAARNWLGNGLDATKRSQIMFMDRDDILNLYVVASLPLPEGALPPPSPNPWATRDEAPFLA